MIDEHRDRKEKHPKSDQEYVILLSCHDTRIEQIRRILEGVASWPERERHSWYESEDKRYQIPDYHDCNDCEDERSFLLHESLVIVL